MAINDRSEKNNNITFVSNIKENEFQYKKDIE